MTILCNLQNINLAFGEKIIFKDAKFSISQGDKIGLIGLNGHGKSTLFNILSGDVTPDIANPPFIFDKHNEQWSLFYVPQELEVEKYQDLKIEEYYLSFYPDLYELNKDLKKTQHELEEDYSNEKLLDKQQTILDKLEAKQAWDIENNYLSYLSLFDLDKRDRDVKSLSGGEQKKIALSAGLSSKANLILWDEPTNHLDVETIEKFEDEIQKSPQTYVIISHDRYLLNHVTNWIYHIEHAQIKTFRGTYLDYLEHLEAQEAELAKNLDKLQNKHRRELAWMRQGIKARGTRSKKRVETYHQMKSDIADLKAKSKKSTQLSLSHSGRKSKQLIEIEAGNFSYDDKVIFNNLDLTLFKGDKIALIGPNGAGKTTLLKLLEGTYKLDSGKYKSLDDLKIITFHQKREALDMNKTPFEMVGDGQDFVHLANGQAKHVISYLEDFLFSRDQVHRPIYTLSGGEKNRLQLAMFMRHSADVWVFDEPTNDLDIETIEILERELASYEAAIIIVGHDRAFLDNTCKKTWLVHENKIEAFDGGYSQVAPFLHALEMEKSLPKEEVKLTPESKSETIEKTVKKKMTYNEKKLWDTIEEDIQEMEATKEDLHEMLSNFDFGDHNPSKNKEYQKLHKEHDELEDKIQFLYAEWDRLSELEY